MNKIKKMITILLLACVFVAQIPALSACAEWAPPIPVDSNVVLLVNSDTGTVLYSKNADQKVYPASITKLMTAILTIEKFKDNLNTQITVQSSDLTPLQDKGSSMMGLKSGEQITVEQLLYGLLLYSGNDAAVVLARAVGGDTDTFVTMMNDKAKELSCENTHYVNPHGLQDNNQYTTARDVYLISKYAMSFDILAQIVNTQNFKFQTNLQHYNLTNTNAMILSGNSYYNKYVKGIKTGSTSDAGICLTSYATNNGINYYCVVMDGHAIGTSGYTDRDLYNANTTFADTKALYQWAFGNFGIEDIVDKGSLQTKPLPIELAWDKTEIQLVAGSQFNALIPKNTDMKTVKLVPRGLPKSVQAPVSKGQKIGEADIMLGTQKLGTVDLVSGESVSRNQSLYFVYIVGKYFSSIWFKITCAFSIAILILFFTVSFLRNHKRKIMKSRKKVYKLP
jgi:D-alanyl-D-alanine carboxypeptidase (penicillin-binding protein 5/6)